MSFRLPGRARVLGAIILLMLVGMVVNASADIISLIAYVSSSLYEDDGETPLADGSYVFIIGSADAINDGMPMYGGCYLAGRTLGDDVFLGVARIGQPPYVDDDNNVVPGTFLSDMVIQWDNEVVEINYLYIRFFNTLDFPGGQVEWGVSPVFTTQFAGPFVVEVDFVGGYLANQTNCFTIIPEPGTMNLIVLCAGLFTAMGAASRRKRRAADPEGSAGREVWKP